MTPERSVLLAVDEARYDGWTGSSVGVALDERSDGRLATNRARVQHDIETSDAQGHSNRVWFDDLVISTERVDCNGSSQLLRGGV